MKEFQCDAVSPNITLEHLKEAFPKIWEETLPFAVQILNKPYDGEKYIQNRLEELNDILACHGIIDIKETEECNYLSFYSGIITLFLNSGDIYCSTILYEVKTKKFYVTTEADYREFLEENNIQYIF